MIFLIKLCNIPHLCLPLQHKVLYSFCDAAVPSMACLQCFGEWQCKTDWLYVSITNKWWPKLPAVYKGNVSSTVINNLAHTGRYNPIAIFFMANSRWGICTENFTQLMGNPLCNFSQKMTESVQVTSHNGHAKSARHKCHPLSICTKKDIVSTFC